MFEPIDEGLRAGDAEVGSRHRGRGFDPFAIPLRPAVANRLVKHLVSRGVDDSHERNPIGQECGRHRPIEAARREGARAVDRIDDPHQALVEPPGVVGRLLRKPARLRQELAELRLQESIDRHVGFGDGRAARLAPDLSRRFEAGLEEAHRERAGLAGHVAKGRHQGGGEIFKRIHGGPWSQVRRRLAPRHDDPAGLPRRHDPQAFVEHLGRNAADTVP
jgi:hypothetical protein